MSIDVLFLGQDLCGCCVVNPILPSADDFLLAFVVDTQFGGGRALPKLLGKRTVSPSAVL